MGSGQLEMSIMIMIRILILHIRLLAKDFAFFSKFRARIPPQASKVDLNATCILVAHTMHTRLYQRLFTPNGYKPELLSLSRLLYKLINASKAVAVHPRGYGIGVSACARNDQASRDRFVALKCTLIARAAHQLTPAPPCSFHPAVVVYVCYICSYGILSS